MVLSCGELLKVLCKTMIFFRYKLVKIVADLPLAGLLRCGLTVLGHGRKPELY